MKQLLVFVSFLVLMTTFTDTSPILPEKDAKQILRTRREDRPRKAGFPDEPMRDLRSATYLAGLSSVCARVMETARAFPFPMVTVYRPKRIHVAVHHSRCMLFFVVWRPQQIKAVTREYMLYLQQLEQRSEEQFLEHWLNPHCLPHCNRDLVHPI